MNRPDWCPEDVWGAAIKCSETVLRNLDQDDVRHEVELIARAILAERERCANIAESHAEVLRENFERYPAIAVQSVAKAIRGETP